MNRQAIRSLSSRARPELELGSGPLSNYFRTFSTTSPLLADEANDSSKPNPTRPNSRAVGQRISEMLKSRPAAAAQAPRAARGEGKVLDVKVLPRGGLRGRGGFRGRGGATAGASPGNRFAGASPGNRFAGAGGRPPSRGNFARGGAPRGRGSRGRGAARRGGRAEGDGEKGEKGEKSAEDNVKKQLRRGEEEDIGMDLSQKQFDHVMRFGEETLWTPELTAESLAPYMPTVPSGSAAAARASLVKNLSQLADGTSADSAGQAEVLHGSVPALELRQNGMRFFPDPEGKQDAEAALQEWRAEMLALEAEAKEAGTEGPLMKEEDKHLRELMLAKGPILKGAEESVRKIVLDKAVRGVHEKPVFAEDTKGLVRSWGLREGTYTEGGRERFEGKVLGLLAKAQKGNVKSRAKA